MKQINSVEKQRTKWAVTRIKAETMEKVKSKLLFVDRDVSQEAFIDSLVNKALGG